jgi:hypothetical protein
LVFRTSTVTAKAINIAVAASVQISQIAATAEIRAKSFATEETAAIACEKPFFGSIPYSVT